MKRRLFILPAAEADVDHAAFHIARDHLPAALRFYEAVEATYRKIRDHPNRWPRFELDHPRLRDLRKCAVVGFTNFSVFYRFEAEAVWIVRVLHGARDLPSILGAGND